MYKKISLILLFLIVTIFSFGSNIKKVRFNTYPPQMVFDLTDDKPSYSADYDEYNRLLFLDIGNSGSYNGRVNNGLPKYIKELKKVSYNKSTGYFLKLNKNIFHRVSLRKSPNRVVVDFSKDRHNKQYTVVIDPGHGGKDPGAPGKNGINEKDLALAVGKYLRDELRKDFNVVMTRDRDEFISLKNRSKIANGIGADLFVSIHINSTVSNTKMNGMEIYYFSKKTSPYAERVADFENSVGAKYGEDTSSIVQIMGEIAYNKNQEKSTKFADDLLKGLSSRMKMKNRGIHGANFAVLRGISCPGVLVELGFIKNPEDYRKMTNKTNQKIMAKKIAEHIRKYFY